MDNADIFEVYKRLAERWRREPSTHELIAKGAVLFLQPSPVFRVLTDRGKQRWDFSPDWVYGFPVQE